MGVVPGPVTVKVPVVIVAGSIPWLKTTLTVASTGAAAAPAAGLVRLTVVAALSGAEIVVKLHGFGERPPPVTPFPAKSLAPAVILKLYGELAIKGLAGVKVAVVPA